MVLADSLDVEAVLGRSLTSDEVARVDSLISKASGLFAREAGQEFVPGETTGARLRVRAGGVVYLPQRPVVSVTAVTDEDGEDLAYTVAGQAVTVTSPGELVWVLVSYTHGGDVPDLVRDTVAEVVARTLRVPDDALAGKTQSGETVGPFSSQSTFAAWAVGGGVRLSPEDVAVARSFRNPWRAVVSLGA